MIFLKSIGVLILIVLVLPVFFPAKLSISRSIEIQALVGTVFKKLTNLNEYMKWNPFPEGDPTNQVNVVGDGVGSYLVWKGEKTGEGKMTITNIDPEKKIDIKMEFYQPVSGDGVVQWLTSSKSDSTTEMTWSFEQDLSYFKRFFGVMSFFMGKHFDKGLLNFKTLVEASK